MFISSAYYERALIQDKILFKHLRRFCEKRKIKISLAGRQGKNHEKGEIFYRNYFGDGNWTFLPRISTNKTYNNLNKQQMIVFAHSTLGFQAIAKGIKCAVFYECFPEKGASGKFNKRGPFGLIQIIIKILKNFWIKWWNILIKSGWKFLNNIPIKFCVINLIILKKKNYKQNFKWCIKNINYINYFIFSTKNIIAKDIPVIVIAPSKKVQSLSTVGTSVTILDEKFFKNSNEFFLGDILSKNTPSTNFFQSGGHGTASAIQLRGLPKRYSTVYIDGVKMSDPSSVSNDYDFNHILTSQISRVEILKGNQSSLYGSGAIGGTIP